MKKTGRWAKRETAGGEDCIRGKLEGNEAIRKEQKDGVFDSGAFCESAECGQGGTVSRWVEAFFAPFRSRERRKEAALIDIALAILGFLFAISPVLFGVRPLGIALLASVGGRAAAVLPGLFLGCLLQGAAGSVYLLLYVLIFVLRFFLSVPGRRRHLPECDTVFTELPQLRISVAVLAGFLLGGYEILAGGVATHTLLFALGAILMPPFFALLFLGVFWGGFSFHDFFLSEGVERVRGTAEVLRGQAGCLALLFCTTLTLTPYSWLGISLGGLFATAAALLAARRFGAAPAAAAGFVAALPLGATVAPAWGFAAFFAGLLRKKGLFWPMTAAVVAGSAWCVAVGGLSAFLGHMPEIAVTALLVWPLAGRIPFEGRAPERRETASPKTEVCETLLLPPAASEQLAEAFGELSRLLYRDAKREKGKETAEAAALSGKILGRVCEGCARREVCFRERSDLPKPAWAAILTLCRTGEVAEGDLALLRENCLCAEAMEERLRIMEWSMADRRHRRGQREAAAGNFDAVSRLLEASAAKVHAKWREDLSLESALKDALREIGVGVGRVTVRGDRVRHIDAGGLRWDGQTLPAERIQAEVERVCGCSLSAPGYEMEDGFVTLHMHTVRRYSARVAVASAPSEAEEVSGDRTAYFETGEDYFYGLLCDGMGSGGEAAGTAELCIGILSGMLKTGNNEDTSLKLLNSLLRAGVGECSTTVDLLEVDLLYGKASFVKSGAAASYVKRGEHLFRIRSDTAPMGILRALDAERIHFSVRPGDEIVLLSDGVSQTVEDAPWLLEFLAAPREKTAEETAREILELARSHGGGDDMTVMLVKIETYRPDVGEAEDAGERITA